MVKRRKPTTASLYTFRDQSIETLIMTRFCLCTHIHRGKQIDLLCTCFPPTSSPSLNCGSFHLSLIYVFMQMYDYACVLITVTLPEDAAQSGDAGDAVWSAAAHLFSANQRFGPFQISDICRPSSYQKQTQLLPGVGAKTNNKVLKLALSSPTANLVEEKSLAGLINSTVTYLSH